MNLFALLGTLALCAWLLSTFVSPITHAVLETHYLVALALGSALAALAWRGPLRMSRDALGRLVLLGFFTAALVALNPWTSINVTSAASLGSFWQWRAPLLAPLIFCAVTWLAARVCAPADERVEESATLRSAENVERFLRSRAARFNLMLLAAAVLVALMALSGRPIVKAFWPAITVVALIWTFDSVLRFVRTPLGASAMCGCTLLATAGAGWAGLSNEARLNAEVSAARHALDAQQPDAANQAYAKAGELAEVLHSTSARVQLETAFAEHDERVQNYPSAEAHWRNVAVALKANVADFAPLQRVRCAQGDSLPVWRKLLFEGFPAVVNPDLTPGLMRLGQIAGDVRAKLLPALAAWELGRPEAERRALLEAVQKVAPNEPTSANLLRTLGVKLSSEKLWLPFELIVGRETTRGGLEGTIEDLGEMRTLVFLNEGHWEMFLRASGTPLHEEWPIIRVEINGQVLGPTQVNKAEDYDVPFTFDVRRADIFQVRLVFVNRQEDLEQGHAAQRGLKIRGIGFYSSQTK